MEQTEISPEELRLLREENEVTQRELAKALGKDFSIISRWEAGDRPIPEGGSDSIRAAIREIVGSRAERDNRRVEKLGATVG